MALKDRFASMSAQSISLQELQHSAQEDTGVPVSITTLREAVRLHIYIMISTYIYIHTHYIYIYIYMCV